MEHRSGHQDQDQGVGEHAFVVELEGLAKFQVVPGTPAENGQVLPKRLAQERVQGDAQGGQPVLKDQAQLGRGRKTLQGHGVSPADCPFRITGQVLAQPRGKMDGVGVDEQQAQ